MEKQRLIAQAPLYYALAIYHHFRSKPYPCVSVTIQNGYEETDYENHETWNYLSNERFLKQAVELLAANGIVAVEWDDFAPPILSPTEAIDEKFSRLSEEPSTPFHRYSKISDASAWLHGALKKIDSEFNRLGITEKDFNSDERDWKPLTIEADDPQTAEIVEKVDSTISAIEANNEYGARAPSERNAILTNLTAFRHTFAQAGTITFHAVKQLALEPLTAALRRFGKSAVGIAAGIAKEVIVAWLKKKGMGALASLDDLF
jgi:hypothetical protein